MKRYRHEKQLHLILLSGPLLTHFGHGRVRAGSGLSHSRVGAGDGIVLGASPTWCVMKDTELEKL